MAFMCFWISHFYQPSIRSFVSTSVRVIKMFPSAKPDSRVTFYSIPLIASSDADSCFAITSVFAHRVKPLLVTLIELQGGLRTNLQLPRIKLAANKIVQTANEWPRFKTCMDWRHEAKENRIYSKEVLAWKDFARDLTEMMTRERGKYSRQPLTNYK